MRETVTDSELRQQVQHEPSWLRQSRLAALDRFRQLPMPKEDKRTTYHQVKLEEGSVQGTVDISCSSSKKIVVVDMKDAAASPLLKQYLNTAIFQENKFAAFNSAFWQAGTLVHVPKNTKAAAPVVIRRQVAGIAVVRTLIIAEELAEVEVVEETEGDAPVFSEVVEIIAEAGSTVRYGGVQDLKGGIVLSTRRAMLGRDAALAWADGSFGGSFIASDISSMMTGSGASTKADGFFFGKDRQQLDLSLASVHAAPDTTTEMLTKGALDDASKAVYRGLIHMKQEAARSSGQQKEETLMLSDNAESDPIPKLQIENNDVKCSHAAAISHVDREKMFYLSSRGVDESAAERMVIESFFAPFCDSLGEMGRICMEKVRSRL